MTADSRSGQAPFWQSKSLEEMTDFGMGKSLRRLRPLLPEQARGGGYRSHLLYRRRLPSSRQQDMPVPRLPQSAGKSRRLRSADPAKPQDHHLASAVVRLRPLVRRQRSLLVASAGFRRSELRACRGRLGARTGHSERDAGARRRARGLHRQLAVEIAKRSETAEVGGKSSARHKTSVREQPSSADSAVVSGCRPSKSACLDKMCLAMPRQRGTTILRKTEVNCDLRVWKNT